MIFVNLAISSFDWIASLLFPGVPNIFGQINTFINNVANSNIISTFRTWLGYIFYFIPWSFVRVLLLAAISLIILRIVFALFRVITDLL